MLKRLDIKKLFGIFDYSIELKPEGLTVLTGPNGYGKTTILRVLEALATKNFLFFLNLRFEKLELIFDGFETISLNKNHLDIVCQTGKIKNQVFINEVFEQIQEQRLFKKLSDDAWLYYRNDSTMSTREMLSLLQDVNEIEESRLPLRLKNEKLTNFLTDYKFPKVSFIKEQRLLRKISFDNELHERRYFRNLIRPAYEEIIEDYAERLKKVMDQADSKYAEKSRELDSSYPRRLFESKEEISENEFLSRYEKIKETQRLLVQYGLSVTKEENPPAFNQDNAKALFVYLSDVELKQQVFDPLLKSLNLYSEILNSRKFANKKIAISKEFGLRFTTDDGTKLQLSELSSGEQHEVIMLFDLLFQTDPNTLILIDEPEISLHIAWQQEFLSDLRKIIEIRKVTVIVATHSPQIIGNEWDSVFDLEERQSHETTH